MPSNTVGYTWKISSWLLAGLLILPILAISYQASFSDGAHFAHLWDSVLPTYIRNSLLLVCGSVILSLLLGLPAAWLMAMYRFPGQRILQWALCLPLAMPAYLVAYIYTDLLDFAGPLQQLLRTLFGWQSASDYWFPAIRSLGGACVVLALVFYPYVYLLTRTALLEQSPHFSHSARLLHCSPMQAFLRVSLPLARPAIAVAASLVAMETLGDYGTVAYFSLPTLTTAVFDTWLGYGNLGSASRIATLMLMLVFLLLLLERYSRRKQRVYQKGQGQCLELRDRLHGWRSFLAQLYCWSLVICAIGIPLSRLLYWTANYFSQSWTQSFLHYSLNSLTVSTLAALCTLLFALLLVFSARLQGSALSRLPMQLVSLGYAIPGTVLAIGLLIPLTHGDHLLNRLFRFWDLPLPGLLFSGSLFALVAAYCVRFSAMMIGSIDSSMAKIPPSLDMASRTLGCTPVTMLRRVHLPLLWQGILTGTLLVFIESMKELNASLLLRPFNFDTLATHVFTFTSDEQLELAALPALILVLVGLIPVILLNRAVERK